MFFDFIGAKYKNIYFSYRKCTTPIYKFVQDKFDMMKIKCFLWYGRLYTVYEYRINNLMSQLNNYPIINVVFSIIRQFLRLYNQCGEPNETYWIRDTMQIIKIPYIEEEILPKDTDNTFLSYLWNSLDTDMLRSWTSKRKRNMGTIAKYIADPDNYVIKYLINYKKIMNIPETSDEIQEVFYRHYDNIISSTSKQLDIKSTLISMRISDNYMHRMTNNNPRYIHTIKSIDGHIQPIPIHCTNGITNKYINRCTVNEIIPFKHFIYITFISEYKNNDQYYTIGIDVRNDYLSGNDILSSSFIYNYLKGKSLEKWFSEDYILDIMDKDFVNFSMKSNEYITIYKDNYIIKEIDLKMI